MIKLLGILIIYMEEVLCVCRRKLLFLAHVLTIGDRQTGSIEEALNVLTHCLQFIIFEGRKYYNYFPLIRRCAQVGKRYNVWNMHVQYFIIFYIIEQFTVTCHVVVCHKGSFILHVFSHSINVIEQYTSILSNKN